MSAHLYLSLLPEALIASMLEPEAFSAYYAVGTQSKTQGQAVFIELDPSYRNDALRIDDYLKRCIPHSNGSPKRSVYISVYRVLERIPLSAMGKLHLVTRDGRSLTIDKKPFTGGEDKGLHFYHELAPTRPAVVSSLGPKEFFELLTGHSGGFEGLPAIAFVELGLGELSADPENGSIGDLPYGNLDHLRHCLAQVKTKQIASKIFDRSNTGNFPYRTVKDGVFVGNVHEGLCIYPMPNQAVLKDKHFDWWRSANT